MERPMTTVPGVQSDRVNSAVGRAMHEEIRNKSPTKRRQIQKNSLVTLDSVRLLTNLRSLPHAAADEDDQIAKARVSSTVVQPLKIN